VNRRSGGSKSNHGSPVTARTSSRLLEGQIVATFGRRHLVELPDATLVDCVTRGKRGSYACGDRVGVAPDGEGRGVIETLEPRKTLLYRSDHARQKLVASNVSQIVVVVAPVPAFYHDLISRCLAAAEDGGMTALILLNKSDLPEAPAALAALEAYRGLGYRVAALSAKRDVGPLVAQLQGRTSVLVGQSGMGKSTIINALIPQAAMPVAEISTALDSGRHTTTHARLFHLDATTHIIDSPGMQAFGLHHLDAGALESAFVEFRPWLGQCRFRDCRHMTEPGCAIAAASAQGQISAARLESYRGLVREKGRGAPRY
jgi:ribosome biogenesis GTPase